MRRLWPLLGVALLGALLALGAAACGDDDDDGGGNGEAPSATNGGPASGDIEVRLLEWSVRPDPEAATAGDVTFNVASIGGSTHELVVIRTELDPGLLPALDDGSVDEAGEGIEIVGEVEELAPGDEDALTLTLDAGSYALVCNLIDELEDGSSRAHYEEGMFAGFSVE